RRPSGDPVEACRHVYRAAGGAASGLQGGDPPRRRRGRARGLLRLQVLCRRDGVPRRGRMHADSWRHCAYDRPADREDVAAAAELSNHGRRERSDEDGDRASRAEDLRLIHTMIKVRQISHATFETPDLEAQIEHYTKVTGLVVAAREKDRALLSTRV